MGKGAIWETTTSNENLDQPDDFLPSMQNSITEKHFIKSKPSTISHPPEEDIGSSALDLFSNTSAVKKFRATSAAGSAARRIPQLHKARMEASLEQAAANNVAKE